MVLRQSWLPGFPDGAQKVGEGLAILEKDGQVTYFVGGGQLFFARGRRRSQPKIRAGQPDGKRARQGGGTGKGTAEHPAPHADELGGTKPQSGAIVFLSAGGAEQAADHDAGQECRMRAVAERGKATL